MDVVGCSKSLYYCVCVCESVVTLEKSEIEKLIFHNFSSSRMACSGLSRLCPSICNEEEIINKSVKMIELND